MSRPVDYRINLEQKKKNKKKATYTFVCLDDNEV